MNKEYVFSWVTPTRLCTKKCPPWWKFWQKPLLIESDVNCHVAIVIDETEANRLKVLLETDSRLIRTLLARSGPDNVWNLQLEELFPKRTEYIKTYGNVCNEV